MLKMYTIETIHWLSLIAPQHPKNEIVKITEPRHTTKIGTIAGLFSGKASLISPSLNNGIAPTTISDKPAT
jgi:hypothetical protein